MRKLTGVLLAGFLFGCGEEPYNTELLRVEEPVKTTESCSATGMCMTCGTVLGMDGSVKMDCGLRLSSVCPGRRDVMAQTSVYKLYFKDKDPEIEEVTKVVQTLSHCRV